MDTKSFSQRVIELAYSEIGPIAIRKGCSPKEAQIYAVANTLHLLLIEGHSEAKEFFKPFLLAAARQIISPVPVTDEYREQLNAEIKDQLAQLNP